MAEDLDALAPDHWARRAWALGEEQREEDQVLVVTEAEWSQIQSDRRVMYDRALRRLPDGRWVLYSVLVRVADSAATVRARSFWPPNPTEGQ
jgi:hypothetical protein